MIAPGVRIFVCTEAVDMRWGFDRLAAAAKSRVGEDPQHGEILVAFSNRGATRLKLLWFDRNGYCVLYKRLHRAVFEVPLAQQIGLDPLQLGLMMVLNLGIGLYTPPVGTTLFISSTIAGSTMSETVRALWPFFFVAIALLVAISYIPALTIRF